MEDLKYPIGKYEPQPFSNELKEKWLLYIAQLPAALENAILNLDEAQLNTPYRPEGWTVKQLVHHVADSHMNAYVRFKWALTDNGSVLKAYDEKQWAELNDVKSLPVNISLTLLHALHIRWIAAIKDLPDDAWEAYRVYHPDSKKEMSLWFLLGMYAWHGRHHVQHILALRERSGWR